MQKEIQVVVTNHGEIAYNSTEDFNRMKAQGIWGNDKVYKLVEVKPKRRKEAQK